MATCRVKRNNAGRITKVTNQDGSEATLYNEIVKHPMVRNEEEALDIFKNTLVGDKLGENPSFTHRINGRNVTSYREALLNTKEGEQIEIGFLSDGEFTPIITVNKTTDRSTQEGLVNNLIERDILSESKKMTRDGYKYQAAGNSEYARAVNTELIREDAVAYLGTRGTQKDGPTFGLNKTIDKVTIIDRDGNSVEYTNKEIDEMSYEELNKITPYALDIIAAREYYNSRPAYGFSQPEVELPTRTEPELERLLTNLLSKLGVTTMSIEQYKRKYQIRNGELPSANALADIANKVIAFNEGEMGLEALTEEVAHFITEATDQTQIQDILDSIHQTEEWNQHADTYREVYSKQYEGEALENMVRREILGKVMTNSILNEFRTEGKTTEQTGFIARALEVLQNFFKKIQNYFRPEYRTQLDAYLTDVNRILRAEEISDMLNTDNLEGNSRVLYSLKGVPKSSISLSAEKAASAIRDQIQGALNRARRGSAINRQQLEELYRKLEEQDEVGSVSSTISLAKSYINMLDKSIEDAIKNGKDYTFTQEENIIYQTLKNQLMPSISEIGSIVAEKKDNRSQWKPLLTELDETLKAASRLEGKASRFESSAISNMIDKIMARHELPETSREYLQSWVKTAEADSNWFHTNFGMLTHSKDGLLNLAGLLQKDIATQSNIRWYESTKNFQQRLRELGISEQEISQFKDGQFLVSEYDFNKFESVVQRLEANIYKDISGSDLTIEEIIARKQEGTLPDFDENTNENIRKETQYRRKVKDLRNHLLERKFNTNYYSEFEEKLNSLGISEEGRRFTLNYYADMSRFKQAAERVTEDGKMILDFTQLSEQDKAVRDNLMKTRNNAKSYFNENGELKSGLEFDENGEVVPSQDIPLSTEAQIAIDLHKLDDPANRDETLNTDNAGIPDIFKNTLRDIEENQGREAALEFLTMNSFIGFSDQYWDSIQLGGNNGIEAKLSAYIVQSTDLSSVEAEGLLQSIREDRNKLKNIVRVYRSKNNPAEVDVDSMPRVARDTVKTIQQRLQDNYRKAGRMTRDITLPQSETTVENQTDTVSSVNDAYFKKLEDLGIEIDLSQSPAEIRKQLKEEIDYATQHMTESNRNEVNMAMESLRVFEMGFTNELSPEVVRVANSLGIHDIQNIGMPEIVKITHNIVRSRLLPYYTRFAPQQYNDFMRELTTGNQPVADMLTELSGRYNYVQVNPNYSYFDSMQNKNINPNFVEDFEGGYLQPKLNLSSIDVNNVIRGIQDSNERAELQKMIGNGFRSERFQELFGGNTSSNLYQAYQATLDYNREQLEAMGVGRGSGYNMYTVPQVREGQLKRFEKLARNTSISRIRELFTEEFTYTEDDKVQGERSKFGDSIKIIPKMYTDRLRNPEETSSELFYSLALRSKEAFLRQARIEKYGDFMAIHDKIVNRTYKGGESKGENTKKMFESAMDYSLFGIKETAMYPIETAFGTIDVAKLARKLLGFVKFRNLGLNVVIPITSYLTGRATREMEKWVGEHIDPRSQILGDKEFRKHATEAFSEIGEINTRAKLNVLGQYFNAFDLGESFQNSDYNKFLRFLPRTGMMLHAGANFPIYGSTMLGVLHDFRVVNGSIIRFNQFQRQKLSEGLSKKEIKNQWDQLENEAIYNYIDVNENAEVTFNDTAIRNRVLNSEGNKMTDAEYEAFKTEKINTIRGHMSNVITNIDGQIPNEARVHAQRHFLLNFFMTHRGWLSIVASRRFKNRHLNVETGEIEEGSYRTVWNYMGRYIQEYRKSNFKEFVKSFKTAFDSADPAEADLIRRNMKRVGIEMSILNGLMLLGFILHGLADDDEFEDSYGIQGMSYLFNRTLNELSSAQTASVSEFAGVIESPFVGYHTVKNFTDVGDLFSGEEVKYGTYRGLSERERFITKMVPGIKQIFDLSSADRIKNMRNTYMFYNDSNFNYTPLGNLYWLSEEYE